MSGEETGRANNSVYYSVFNGAFRTRVPEGTPDALTRINKNNKEVYEREVRALFGFIEHIEFEDTADYGKRLKITLDANEEGNHPVLTFGVESRDGRDLLRKLPAIDFTKEVRFMPYKFADEGEEKGRSGISITQRDVNEQFTEKIQNFFWDADKKEYIHGHPTIDWDAAKESEQKIYLIQRDEFLINYVVQHVLPKLQQSPKEPLDVIVDEPKDDINPDDIPF